MSVIRRLQRALKNKVTQPDYSALSNVVFHGRAEGLVTNSDNDYGIVDVSGNVTTWKSVSPHATGVNFTSVGTAPTLTGGSVVFGGAGSLRHATVSTFNFMHYASPLNTLKWTIHGVLKVGAGSNPNAAYGICGNNGSSSSNKGIALFYDDRAAQSVNNQIKLQITKGVGGTLITLADNTNVLEPNRLIDFWMQCDKSLAQEDQIKLFINGQRIVVSNEISSSPVTTPTYAMEIGALGNSVLPGVLTMEELTIQSGVETDSVRGTFITARMYKYGITPYPNVLDGVTLVSTWNLYDTLDESRYYLSNILCQKPSDSNTIVEIFSDGTSHVYDANKKVSMRKSINKGQTWSSKTTVFDPVGAEATQGVLAGYGDDDRLHVLADTHTGLAPGETHKLMYCYSDDDGDNWTSVDITSSIPSDGLNLFRVYGRVIENDGRLIFPYYKSTDEGDATDTSRYMMYSDDNGSTWTSVLIQASTGANLNESEIIALSSTVLVQVTREDGSNRWYQSRSTNNGASWTHDGVLTFGEPILTRAAPVRLRKFQISSTDVIACYYSIRDKDVYKVAYCLASDLISSGTSAWSVARKFTIHQGSNSEHLHYGDVCHYDNDFNAFGQSVIDPFPSVGAGTENVMYTFNIPTFHYPFIKSALGL